MRLQSDIRITVKEKIIGGAVPLICLPLVADDTSELLAQAESFKPLVPDLIEWRIDGFGAVMNVSACLEALKALKAAIGEIPLILTCRIHSEGGMKEISPEVRLGLVTAAIDAGGLDIVDVELRNSPAFIDTVKKAAKANGTRLILSHHDFLQTPDAAEIHDRLVQAQDMGADIAKVAVMPKDRADVLTLLSATLKARTGAVKIPMVTISMGALGMVTRVAGGLFGSDITFAIGKSASAPGQIHIAELRQAMAVFYPPVAADSD